jgi:catechol 2,3-dioxygenase-like lactoylglutathione lyase family enzyme
MNASASPRPSIDHAFVLVSDVARSRAFYESLGLEVVLDEGEYLRFGGSGDFTIGMEQGDPARIGGGGIEIDLLVGDVDERYRELSSAGVRFSRGPVAMPWGARHAFLEDPDGYPLSIFTPE